METVYILGYLLLLGGGGVMSLYLYKNNIKAPGQFLGVSSLALGLAGLVSSFLGLDGAAYLSIWIAFGFSLVGTFYIEFKKPRVIILLAVPFYVLFLTFTISLPFLVLFATLALEIGFLDAYQFSRLDIPTFAKVIATDKSLGVLLAPFSVMSLSIRRVFRGRLSKSIMFFSYSLLPIVLVLVAVVLWFFAGAEGAYILTIVTGGYLAVASNNFIKGTRQKGSPDDPDRK